jgi:DNA gyrase subunit B
MSISYDSNQIIVLSGLEAVRKRPGMYIGDVHDGSGLHHLLWEVVANSVDQHLARRLRRLRVDLEGPWATVADDGPGIYGPIIERIMTTLHDTATLDGHFPHIHLSDRGVGLAAVNAVCERFEVESADGHRKWRANFERGVCVEPATRCVDRTERSGTRIRFRADEQIFSNTLLDPNIVEARLREIAAMNPLLEIMWNGVRIRNEHGIRRWVAERLGTSTCAHGIHSGDRFVEDTWVDVALGWSSSARDPGVVAFVNMCRSPTGAHVRGLWEGIADAARVRPSIARELFERDLAAVLHVGVFRPTFDMPTRTHLLTTSARNAARRVVGDLLREAHPCTWPKERVRSGRGPRARSW